MKWICLIVSVALILIGGIITDAYFHPGKATYDEQNRFRSGVQNPNSWTGLACLVDGLFVGAWAVALGMAQADKNKEQKS